MSTMIGKSGTGIGKSGTGIEKSGTGRGWTGLFLVALVGLFGLTPLMASANNLQVSQHDGFVTVSLHDKGQVVAGRAALVNGRADYLTVPLATVNFDTQVFDPFSPDSHGSGSGTASHGSGSGQKSHGSGSGTTSHGSGSGITSHGSGSGTTSHGSGSGTTSHGSGSGTTSHGSGSGTTSHGSGSGTTSHGSGSGTTSHGSGSGQSERADWGYAEIVIDSQGVDVIVYKLTDHGMSEHLLAFGPALARGLQSSSPAHLQVVTP